MGSERRHFLERESLHLDPGTPAPKFGSLKDP